MRTQSRRAGWAVVAALGLAGLALAHVLEYLALVPDAHHRAHVLSATGHQYLPSALSGAGFLAAVALAAVFLRGFGAGAGEGAHPPGPGWVRLLPVAQALAFVVVEVGERFVAGASLGDLGPVLVLGLPLQVLAGIAGGWVVSAVARAGARLAHALTPRPPFARRRSSAGWSPQAGVRLVSRLASGTTPARGPPSLLVPVCS
jgi:hypothetical protein